MGHDRCQTVSNKGGQVGGSQISQNARLSRMATIGSIAHVRVIHNGLIPAHYFRKLVIPLNIISFHIFMEIANPALTLGRYIV